MATLLLNKKASFNYEIVEKLEAGIKLFGHEVKSLRRGHGSLDGAYVTMHGHEACLVGVHISPYQPGNLGEGYNPERGRALLLNKKEIEHLIEVEKHKGLTVIPLSMYTKGRHIKVALAIARGKKKFDKRETIKKRDADRDIRRTLRLNHSDD